MVRARRRGPPQQKLADGRRHRRQPNEGVEACDGLRQLRRPDLGGDCQTERRAATDEKTKHADPRGGRAAGELRAESGGEAKEDTADAERVAEARGALRTAGNTRQSEMGR